MLAGCGSDVDYSCEINDDCVEGRLCGPEGECIQRDPVWIVTEELPDATVDAEYSFTLEAADGISPYTWSLTENPDWLSIDSGTGTLSGTPDQVATGLAVFVRVEDSTTGRDNYKVKELSIDVNLCSEGDTTVCYEPDNGKCLEGIKRCSGGDWGPCGDAAFSTNKDHCGPDCGACDEQISDRCTRGDCACGDGAPCTGDEICCEAACVDPNTDSANCGACGNDCTAAMQNVTNPHCADGVCAHDGCATGFLDCNDVLEDGCETEVSLSQCGACDRDCSVLTKHVEEILCVDTAGTFDCGYQGDGTHGEGCVFEYLDCDGNRANGCETPVNSQDHCGFCGNVCDAHCMLHPNGDHYYCGCRENYDDCGDGRQCCEGYCFNIFDPAHCGNCDHDCNPLVENVVNVLCDQGTCDYDTCLDLFLDCDSDRTNGCEKAMDDDNCGACDFSCGADARCDQGSCVCDANMGNCNTDWTDGCESNLLTSEENCGNCGIDCNVRVQNVSTLYCDGGLCNYSECVSEDYDDCDADRTNGCEADLLRDNLNCGECGITCYGYPCMGGNCRAICSAPYADCDGKLSTNCETDTSTDVHNCGSCGNECGFKNYCCLGFCSTEPCI
jgi:hypothetical protein